MRDQPWHIYFALVHLSPLRPPLHVAPQLGEPGAGRGAIGEARDIDDSPPLVVCQYDLADVRIE